MITRIAPREGPALRWIGKLSVAVAFGLVLLLVSYLTATLNAGALWILGILLLGGVALFVLHRPSSGLVILCVAAAALPDPTLIPVTGAVLVLPLVVAALLGQRVIRD